MDTELLQQILGAGPLQEQATQTDQQLADLIARRKAYQPQHFNNGLATALGGIGDIIMGQKFNQGEQALRGRQTDLAKQMAAVRGAYGNAALGAPMGPSTPPGMPSDNPPRMPPSAADTLSLARAGQLSGDPLMAKAGASAVEQAEKEPALALERQKLQQQGPQPALGGLTPSAYELITKRQQVPKFAAAFPGSEIYDQRTGRRPPGAGGGSSIVKQTADGIENGTAPPDMKGLGRLRVPVQAELATRGFNLAQANLDWQATQKHLATLNGPGQERLNQAINFVSDTIPVIRQLYAEWQQQASMSGYRILNKATLAAMKQLPGRPGAVAQALETQINDFASELGTVYKGGGTSTDKSLGMAASNLQADWNPETFNKALDLAERNIAIRKNSVTHSQMRGASAGNPYGAPQPAAAPEQPPPTQRLSPTEIDALKKEYGL